MGEEWQRPTADAVGRITVDSGAAAEYVKHLLTSVHQPLSGLKVVVDGANGGYTRAAELLKGRITLDQALAKA